MKKFLVIMLALIMVFSLAACAPKDEDEEEDIILGVAGGGAGQSETEEREGDPETRIPPPGIWHLTGEVEYRHVLEDGYYEDLLVEIDFGMTEGSYPKGKYTGDVYIEAKIDAEDYIKEMMKGLEGIAGINFDLEGYAYRTLLPLHVIGIQEYNMEGPKFPTITNQDGEQISAAEEEYVGATTFMMAFKVDGEAGGWGDTGGGAFSMNHDMKSDEDGNVTLRVIIEPDSVWGNSFYESNTGTRKVLIEIDLDGTVFTGEGKLERSAFSSANQNLFLNRESIGERRGVEPTS